MMQKRTAGLFGKGTQLRDLMRAPPHIEECGSRQRRGGRACRVEIRQPLGERQFCKLELLTQRAVLLLEQAKSSPIRLKSCIEILQTTFAFVASCAFELQLPPKIGKQVRRCLARRGRGGFVAANLWRL